jgi:hypothetical protein
MKNFLIPIIFTTILSGCLDTSKDQTDLGSADGYTVRMLTDEEKKQLIDDIESVIGVSYTWGGDTISTGFDCSGLIQWAYRKQGFGFFINNGRLKTEITAHDLYHQNSIKIDSENIYDLQRGDFIFFDENSDGRITHNSVFDKIDHEGSIWVYDAYSIDGMVSHRVVENFFAKGPYLAYSSKVTKNN